MVFSPYDEASAVSDDASKAQNTDIRFVDDLVDMSYCFAPRRGHVEIFKNALNKSAFEIARRSGRGGPTFGLKLPHEHTHICGKRGVRIISNRQLATQSHGSIFLCPVLLAERVEKLLQWNHERRKVHKRPQADCNQVKLGAKSHTVNVR